MHVGFPSFIPKSVTEYSIVYSSMLNFVKITKQLDQNTLPILCDKGVFRTLADIYLHWKDELQILIQMLCGFHAGKCVKHCIDKYIQESWIEGSFWQTKVFGVNAAHNVLNGINHKQSFMGYPILANVIEKWDSFLQITDISQFDGFSDATKSLQIAFA